MKQSQMVKQVKQYTEMYHGEHTYILAVSAGVDSSVLMEMMYQLGCHIHVVHFNHHKREQSKQEAAHIKTYCQKRKIPCDIIDVPNLAGNFQNEAREFRYAALRKVASRYPMPVITTAHHLDDQTETYIQRLFSGSSIVNRGGMLMYEKRGDVDYFRPFLYFEKEMLYTYANDGGIIYFEDASNHEDIYQRNQIRNQILPIIAQSFPQYKHAIHNDQMETQLLHSFLTEKYEIFKQYNVKNNGEIVSFPYAAFIAEHRYFQNFILKQSVTELGFHLKRARYDEIVAMIYAKKQTYMVKEGLHLHVIDDRIMIGKSIAQKYEVSEYSFFLKDGFLKLPKQYNMWYNDRNNGSDDFLEICETDLPFLKVRNSQRGDKVQFGSHHKRVNRLFIDQKLLQLKRNSYPIVEDIRTKQIVWIPMLYKSYNQEKIEKMIRVYFSDGGFHA